jgi:hypothetical protein
MNQQVQFLKNLAIMGALIELGSSGTGRLSLTKPENDSFNFSMPVRLPKREAA